MNTKQFIDLRIYFESRTFKGTTEGPVAGIDYHDTGFTCEHCGGQTDTKEILHGSDLRELVKHPMSLESKARLHKFLELAVVYMGDEGNHYSPGIRCDLLNGGKLCEKEFGHPGACGA